MAEDKSSQSKLPAEKLLQNFITEKKLVLKFPKLKIRQIDDGAIIIEQPSTLDISYESSNTTTG